MQTLEELSEQATKAIASLNGDVVQQLADAYALRTEPLAQAESHLLCGIAYRIAKDYESSHRYLVQALQAFVALDDKKGQARAHVQMGTTWECAGEAARAIECAEQAFVCYQSIEDIGGMASVVGNLGNTYMNRCEYSSALREYQRALLLFMEVGNKEKEAIARNNIGQVHQRIGDYTSAIEQHSKAMALFIETGNNIGIAKALVNIGIVLATIADYPAALESYERALQLFEENGDVQGQARALAAIGNTYQQFADYGRAFEYIQRAEALFVKIGDKQGVANATLTLGNALASMDRHAEAMHYYRQAMVHFEELSDDSGKAYVVDNMIESLLTTGDVAKATELLPAQHPMEFQGPTLQLSTLIHRAQVLQHGGQLEEAQVLFNQALDLSISFKHQAEEASIHDKLRTLAHLRDDFAAYVHHNKEHQRITHEIAGRSVTQRMATVEMQRALDKEHRKREKEKAVLYSTLPKHIADTMLSGALVVPDQFDHAAVLFADIVGFTKQSARLDARSVVALLGEVFAEFDEYGGRNAVMKIKNMGDAYLCLKGDGTPHENVAAVCTMAWAMMQHPVVWPGGEPLQLRIGIHVGPVTAGVIGSQRLQYDVWGDTVNMASRLESTSEPGRIQISKEVKILLDTGYLDKSSTKTQAPFTCFHRGGTALKGKGIVETYWLECR